MQASEVFIMFRRVPGPVGYNGERLGMWEYQSEAEATELIQHRRDRAGRGDEHREQERPGPNFARLARWGRK